MQVTIETVILTAVMVTTMIAALYTAYNMVEAQVQTVDLNNAKNLVKYLADAIEQLAVGSGGARYVRFPAVKGIPEYSTDVGVIRVYVYNGSWVEVCSDEYDVFMYRGGELAAFAEEVVRPEVKPDVKEKLIVGLNDPVVVVYTARLGRPYVIMEAARVRAGYLGTYTVGRAFEEKVYHVYLIEYVKLVVGNITGSGKITVIAENRGVRLDTYIVPSSTIMVRVEKDGDVAEVQLKPENPSAAPESYVIVRVVEIRVRGP